MSRDRREEILARLQVIGATLSGINLSARNMMTVQETRRPAIIISDGDETFEDPPNLQRPNDQPYLVDMTPEVRLMLQADATAVGSSLNALRAEFIKKVLTDAELRAATGSNGYIRPVSCETTDAQGRKIEGEMLVGLLFRYPLVTSEL